MRLTFQRFPIRPQLALVVAALLFGFLVAQQVQVQRERAALTVRYNTPLIEAADQMQKEQASLKAQLAELRGKLDGIQRSSAAQSGIAADLATQIDALKLGAGLVAMAGEGVVVVLDDARGVPADAKNLEKAICHSTDLTDIVNTGWKGGAEAIAINEERIVGTSSVYCVGSTIMVNGTLMSPPFVISMIGAQASLARVFDDPGELSDIKQRHDLYGLGFRVARQREVRVPAFTGGLGARHAVPAQ